VYESAANDERRAVHQAIADVTDPTKDPDRRAWHRAAASAGPDEDIASELQRSAERAQARGGKAAEAAFLERAAALTPDSARRAMRALAAAQAKLMAGSPEGARQLAGMAETGPLDPLDGARLELLLAQTALYPTFRPYATRLLVDAARRLAPLDAALSRETYFEAIQAALFAGRLADEDAPRAAGAAALSAPAALVPPRPVDVLLDGWATRLVEGAAAGFPKLKQALAAFRTETDVRWLGTGLELWDDDAWGVLASRLVQAARETGTLTALPVALNHLAMLHTFRGHFDTAAAIIQEAGAIGSAIGAAPRLYAPLFLAGWRGRLQETRSSIAKALADGTARGEGLVIMFAQSAWAVQHIGLGHYDTALEAAQEASDPKAPDFFAVLWLPEMIEAAVRNNKPDVAGAALHRLSTVTRASGTQWALGVEARSRALVCEDRIEAERLYGEALKRLGGTTIAVDLARAHLLYGEWLRRERRRTDAREHLRTAYDMFSTMGAEAFAERVARELRATGERARKRSVDTTLQLTPQQAQIARMASKGNSNREIAARLFISPRTVEYHLHQVFTTLGITSRKQLAGALD
jgi:DNA-binding CsgD family transcriptional regulator